MTLNSGESCAAWQFSRRKLWQNESIVPICALAHNALCRLSLRLSGSAARRSDISSSMRLRSSAAAALVKVMTRKLSISASCSILRSRRSVSTLVFPLPKQARRARFPRSRISATLSAQTSPSSPPPSRTLHTFVAGRCGVDRMLSPFSPSAKRHASK